METKFKPGDIVIYLGKYPKFPFIKETNKKSIYRILSYEPKIEKYRAEVITHIIYEKGHIDYWGFKNHALITKADLVLYGD